MQVGARIDPVRDTGAEDGEDPGRPRAAEVAVGEEPVLPPEHERAELALEAVVRQLKPPVREEQDEAIPLAMEVAERLAERRLRWDDAAMLIEPGAQLGDR